MAGDIYTSQRCPLCGARFKHNPKRRALVCPKHPVQRASSFFVRFGRQVKRQFSEYARAERFLNELRSAVDHGRFDPLDHRRDSPYFFRTQAHRYLSEKAESGLRAFRKLELHISRATDFFGEENVKDINRQAVKDYLSTLPGQPKTRANYRDALSTFFRWLVEEEVIESMPRIPRIEYELGYRCIVNLATQREITDTVQEITAHDPKIWLGIELLCTYPALRPGDLLRILERDIRLEHAAIIIWRPTKRKNTRKTIPLIPEHIELIREMQHKYPALPEAPFFRHSKAIGGPHRPFLAYGHQVFRKAWNAACKELGIQGVDLYGGTRHSTTTALAVEYGHEAVRAATQHETNKAFDRYCQAENVASMPMAHAAKKMRGGRSVVRPDFKAKEIR